LCTEQVIRQLELYKAVRAPGSEELHFRVLQKAGREMGKLPAKYNSTLWARTTVGLEGAKCHTTVEEWNEKDM